MNKVSYLRAKQICMKENACFYSFDMKYLMRGYNGYLSITENITDDNGLIWIYDHSLSDAGKFKLWARCNGS